MSLARVVYLTRFITKVNQCLTLTKQTCIGCFIIASPSFIVREKDKHKYLPNNNSVIICFAKVPVRNSCSMNVRL